jgi:D-3-phosphoglycerate dehydrogenase
MKILISDGLAQKGIDLLSSVSEFEVEIKPGLSPEELKSAVSDAEALVIRSGTKVTEDVIASASTQGSELLAGPE